MMNDERNVVARHSDPGMELHIGELVLDGFDGVDGAGVGAVVQEELTRLFVERGVPDSLVEPRSVVAVDAGTMTLRPNLEVHAIGVAIARVVYEELST